MAPVPDIRISPLNDAPLRPDGEWVLYWMTAFRRPDFNFALDRAVEHATRLEKPLVILEPLRNGYAWASDRHHAFIIEGMQDNAEAFADLPVTYYPYLEVEEDAGRGLLQALAERACVVISDDFPAFMLPRMTAAAGRKIDVMMERVDSNGLFPMRSTDKEFTRAYSFRRHLQKVLPEHLEHFPKREPLAGLSLPHAAIPDEILERWPAFDPSTEIDVEFLAKFPIDHEVPMVDYRGGWKAARELWREFADKTLARYGEDRSHPDDDAASGLSPYLHFGHISAHEIFADISEREDWSPDKLPEKSSGSRSGWWQMSPTVESFLDELITWREVGFNMCVTRPDDYDRYESLPDWAKTTLEEHADDPREYVYTLEEFEHARTHDDLWNAAQRQLVVEGRIQNYLRMLWGKKILHWTASPQDALAIMVELNNKYAVDGRDPNSYSGIFWVLGRYDRAWGPEREIFGKIRYMTSRSARSKLRLKAYLRRWSSNSMSLFDLS